MKKTLLTFFLLLFTCNLLAQNIDLKSMISKFKKDTEIFQKSLTANDYKLFKTSSNTSLKIDSISYINRDKVEIGIVKSRKNNFFYINDISEYYFKNIEDQLSSEDFKIVKTEIKKNNSILKTYVDKINEAVVYLTIRGISGTTNFSNEFTLKIEFPSNFKIKFRKELL